MGRTRIAVSLAALALFAVGCAVAPAAAPSSASPAAAPSSATSATGATGGATPASPQPTSPAVTATALAPGQHVAIGPLGLDAPTGWQVRSGLPNPSGNFAVAYLGPSDLARECEPTSQGSECHAWPIVQLDQGGVVVALRLYGMPGSKPPAGGTAVTVAGLPARRLSTSADASCQSIGGKTLTRVMVPRVPGLNGWVSLDACFAGGDVAAAEAAFEAILSSVTVAGDGATP